MTNEIKQVMEKLDTIKWGIGLQNADLDPVWNGSEYIEIFHNLTYPEPENGKEIKF